jgi:aryl-alcohol dehydrogenase-like predicted oxidoreductase
MAQVQFSLISRGPQQMETKAICDQLGIRLIAYSPLGLGARPRRAGGGSRGRSPMLPDRV